ncbi:exodeoxyribonuclease V subunit alpha [Millisia brevis]|uniref:exodeoxyribonuclease V subunit alpha n=1 Tax=Millisia brevis TaxID=264148 RepID=UPI00083538E8|nr:exodeoxyribonuclease V subunit alpha [Millisia brevis]
MTVDLTFGVERVQRLQRAGGLLADFNTAAVLTAADVHVALRLGALAGEADETVLLATALTVRAVRIGSVCLEIGRMREIVVDDGVAPDESAPIDPDSLDWPSPEETLAALRRSPLVIGGPAGPLRPLRLVERADGIALLYLDRYYRQEEVVRSIFAERADKRYPIDLARLQGELDTLFPSAGDDRQRSAALMAATHATTILIGGPGTGKTYTIARILAALIRTADRPLRVALAAPTGKAAARMQELVRQQAAEVGLTNEFSAMTLHRLLGSKPGTQSRFEHDAHNRLPHDVVVVDETSMVPLTMMARLLEALRPDARLILVGDPDQLTSVEAGAVLADLVATSTREPSATASRTGSGADSGADIRPVPAADTAVASGAADVEVASGAEAAVATDPSGIVRLVRPHRFGGRIADLADAVQRGDEHLVLDILAAGGDEVVLDAPDRLGPVRADTVRAARAATEAAAVGDAAAALHILESHRVLCAHRAGPSGVRTWARRVREWLDDDGVDTRGGGTPWFPGRPLLVTANDYRLGLYNGDTGVIVSGPDGVPMAAFPPEVAGGSARLVHPSALSAVQTAYAMTIHRSQGSQFKEVSVILPAAPSALLSRELLYTAITRARSRVRLIGTPEALAAGVRRRVQRTSGLR